MDGFLAYWLAWLWEELMVFLLLWGPLLLLAAVCVLTLNTLPPQRRRGLFALFFSMLGLVTGILTVVYARRWLPERHPTAGRIVVRLSVLCLASAMFVGSVAGALWCMGPGETVGTYRGRKVVQGKWVWMDISYNLYEYHGPLVRGKDSITWGEMPLLDGVELP